MKINDYINKIFIYESKRLNEAITVAEAGLSNISKILVIDDKDVIGG